MLIGLLVGVFSGLFGVGGGIILVPILVLLWHIEQKKAQATSLVMVSIAATTGTITYALGLNVEWSAVIPLVCGGLGGTWLGTRLIKRTPDRWLQIAFAGLLLVAAIRMFWSGSPREISEVLQITPSAFLFYVLSGVAMGLLSSFLGVGGGVIVIPLLVSFFGFSQQLAAGTSLAVMIPLSLVGALRLTRVGYTDWGQGLRIGAPAAAGAVAGASAALALPSQVLRIGFGVLLVFSAGQMMRKAYK